MFLLLIGITFSEELVMIIDPTFDGFDEIICLGIPSSVAKICGILASLLSRL